MGIKFLNQQMKTETFVEKINNIVDELKDKEVLVVAEYKSFTAINKKFKLDEKIDIKEVIVPDSNFRAKNIKNKYQINSIDESEIDNYNAVFIINDDEENYISYLAYQKIDNNIKAVSLYSDEEACENNNLKFLYGLNFPKNYKKTLSKLKNKKVVLYGAGILFNSIAKICDLSKINILAIADKKYSYIKDEKECMGYKTITPSEIAEYKPEYILITTKKVLEIKEYLSEVLPEDFKVKIETLPKRGFLDTLKEAFDD